MFPFINQEKHIIFWWSAKAGCSTVKSIMFEIINQNSDCKLWEHDRLHNNITKGKIDLNRAKLFTNILFIRNPYKRFVSGVIDKNINGELTKFYKPKNFIDAASNIDLLDGYRHHFAPQTSEHFIPNLKFDYIYDIEKINYEELSSICNFKITERKRNQSLCTNPGNRLTHAYLLDYETLVDLKFRKNIPPYECFYSSKIKNIIDTYYKKDFVLFKKYNFNYEININTDDIWLNIFV